MWTTLTAVLDVVQLELRGAATTATFTIPGRYSLSQRSRYGVQILLAAHPSSVDFRTVVEFLEALERTDGLNAPRPEDLSVRNVSPT